VRTFQRAVDQIVEIATSRLAGTHGARVAIIHSMSPDLANSVSDRLVSIADLGSIYICSLGPTVGTHAGPGAVGAIFIV
jgi:fatty acid-binding protein DegV